ncbi:MAG: hypothetical protein NXI17_09285 [Alphaproteobacteria bacterium]|nr:hypothetical protein [Alphaproteobacteria bacterium]
MFFQKCLIVVIFVCVTSLKGVALAKSDEETSYESAVNASAKWSLHPNLVVISRLEFPARYLISVDENLNRPGRIEPLVGLKRTSFYNTTIEQKSQAIVDGVDIGLFGNAATFLTAPTGTFELDGLSRDVLVSNSWGGSMSVQDIIGDEIVFNQSLKIAEFQEPHFVRVCLNDVVRVGNSTAYEPVIAFSVDDEAIVRSARNANREIALWRSGCVDLSGSKFSATLVRKVDSPSIPIPGVFRALGNISFAPLSAIKSSIDLTNKKPPILHGGEFSKVWRTIHRKAIIAHKLPFSATYAISYLETMNDGTTGVLEVARGPGDNPIIMHEGGGVVVHGSQISLSKAPPSGYGKMSLIGYSEADFKFLKFKVSGSARTAPLDPTRVIARFAAEHLVRVCIDSAKWTDIEIQTVIRPHATLFIDGQMIPRPGAPTPLFNACTDFAAKSIELGLLPDSSVGAGKWTLNGTLYYRLLPHTK